MFTNEYHAATHQYRNLEYQLKRDFDNHILDRKTIVQLVQQYCQMIIDSICVQLEQVTNHKISGCIKLVNPDETGDHNFPVAIGNQTVSDFVRSSNTEEARRIKPYKKVLIRDNTDYLEIMDPNNTRIQFYQPNLVAYAKRLKADDHEYMNSTSDWKEKYRSTAVAPIQIDGRFIPEDEEGIASVIGFLCVDAKESNALPMKQKRPIMAMLKAYSDLLYCVLDMYSLYLRAVSCEEYEIEYVKTTYPNIREYILDESVPRQ